MGLRINTNVLSLGAQHKLQGSSTKLATALERLSSGLRINRGADDVVGLLTSENLRASIRGIGAAQNAITSAKNLLGVSEGALAQLTDLAQRIREKTVQGADNSISSADRTNLGTAITDLLSEYNRIATGASFNGVQVLDGTFTAKRFQIGPDATDSLSISISDSRASAIGQIALVTATTIRASGKSGSDLDLTFAASSALVINNVTFSSTSWTTDGVSNIESDESAIAYVNAINSLSGQTNVIAKVNANVVTLAQSALTVGTASSTGLSSNTFLTINGITLTAQTVECSNSTEITTFFASVNALSTRTGVTVSGDSSNYVFTALDGRNIDFQLFGAFSGGAGALTAAVNVLGLGLGFSGSEAAIATSVGTSTAAVFRGTFRLFSDSAFTTANGTEVLGTSASSVAVSTSLTLQNVSVSTSDNATTAIFNLDNVIRQLQTIRSNVGSKTNRLDVTTAELDNRQENLVDSESKIRDTDVAAETARLTSAQILQQAGIQVLARANAAPQIALTLLQG